MPICAHCGNDVPALFVRKRQICHRCYNHQKYINKHREICASCGKTRAVETRTDLGPICSSCHAKSQPKQECYFCHKSTRTNAIVNEHSVCCQCYRLFMQAQEICVYCGCSAPIEKHTQEGPVCKPCYNKNCRPKHQCTCCLEMKPIKSKGLCQRCYVAHRMATDENFCLRQRIRSRLSHLLRRSNHDVRHSVWRGIDLCGIAAHLGPCPGDIREYHIDHIRPLASFNLMDPDQVCLAFAPENHQWLRSQDNLKKGVKYA